MKTAFELGDQPCGNFRERDELFTGSGNLHECFGPYGQAPREHCHRKVSNCANCGFDHHERGWEWCGRTNEEGPLDPGRDHE